MSTRRRVADPNRVIRGGVSRSARTPFTTEAALGVVATAISLMAAAPEAAERSDVIFQETTLPNAFVVELERLEDERGFFARTFCASEFTDHGLVAAVLQANLSFNHKQGTLRGMHYQLPPATEAKLVRCTRGAIYDVIIDLRPNSPTYLHHYGIELSAESRTALYVPEMFAHGFQTLVDQTEVTYQVSEFYTPGQERGIRYDDPAFAIEWPLPVGVISKKDSSWPHFRVPTQTGR
jgi:dTDP-4-dehydrorhamnose 3,5-epimerase